MTTISESEKILFIFDMDGTLLPGTTASLEIARVTNRLDQLHQLEKAFYAGQITNQHFAKTIFDEWAILSHDVVQEAFETAPKLRSIEKTLTTIHQMGGVCCLMTLSPICFAEHFRSFGFDHIFASDIPLTTGGPWNPDGVLHGGDKPLLAKKLADQLGIRFEKSVAFGDSMTDVPLFNALETSVAVNAKPDIQAIATHSYNGLDLEDALFLVEDLLYQPNLV